MSYTEAIEHAITALMAQAKLGSDIGFDKDAKIFREAYKTLQQYLEKHEDN